MNINWYSQSLVGPQTLWTGSFESVNAQHPQDEVSPPKISNIVPRTTNWPEIKFQLVTNIFFILHSLRLQKNCWLKILPSLCMADYNIPTYNRGRHDKFAEFHNIDNLLSQCRLHIIMSLKNSLARSCSKFQTAFKPLIPFLRTSAYKQRTAHRDAPSFLSAAEANKAMHKAWPAFQTGPRF